MRGFNSVPENRFFHLLFFECLLTCVGSVEMLAGFKTKKSLGAVLHVQNSSLPLPVSEMAGREESVKNEKEKLNQRERDPV